MHVRVCVRETNGEGEGNFVCTCLGPGSASTTLPRAVVKGPQEACKVRVAALEIRTDTDKTYHTRL